MRIGFIGSGKVATAFGLYLSDKSQEISGYYSRHHSSAISASKIVQTESFQTLEELIAASDWIGITTTDDQIESVVSDLFPILEIGHPKNPSKVFFHMSGSKSSECLYPLREKGYQCLSIHPLQSISNPIIGKQLLETCYFSVEGDSSLQIETFLKQLSHKVIRIQTDAKPLYHAAACVASNYLYALADQAIQMMVLAGFEADQGRAALLPLMKGTLENLEKCTPESALTGPIARGDLETVRKHIQVLGDHEPLKRVYKEMGLVTLQLASKEQLEDEELLQTMMRVLSEKEELK